MEDTDTCTDRVTACTGGAGYNSGTKLCVTSGAVTSAAQCMGLTSTPIYNEVEDDSGSGTGAGSCVGGVVNCDDGEVISASACVSGLTACTGGAGFDNAGRVCVAAGSVTDPAHCRANNEQVLLSAVGSCAQMCAGATEAPGADGTGRCAEAATVCGSEAGYNSTSRTCVAAADATAPQCVALMRVLLRVEDDGCAAICAENGAPSDAGACGEVATVCSGGKGYDPDLRVCKDAGSIASVRECFGANNIFNATPSGRRHLGDCVAMATDCDDDEAVSADNVCTDKADVCTGGAGYNETTQLCVVSGEVTGLAQCAGLTNMIYNEGNTANMGACVAAATGCDDGEVVDSNECEAAATGMRCE